MKSRVVKAPAERRAEILDCAQELFLERGYERTAVQDVAKRVQVSQGTFYYYFPSKESVLAALAERLAQRMAEAIAPIAADTSQPPIERLNRLLMETRRLKVGAAISHGAVFRTLFEPENLAYYERIKAAVFEVLAPPIEAILREGDRAGVFRTEDPARTAHLVLHMSLILREFYVSMNQATTDRERTRAGEDFDAALAFYGRMVDRVLGAPEGSVTFNEPGFAARLMEAWDLAKATLDGAAPSAS